MRRLEKVFVIHVHQVHTGCRRILDGEYVIPGGFSNIVSACRPAPMGIWHKYLRELAGDRTN